MRAVWAWPLAFCLAQQAAATTFSGTIDADTAWGPDTPGLPEADLADNPRI